jgi:hypothetical protein
MNRLFSVLAFASLLVFFGVLVYRVPRLDLGAVVVITTLLVAYDLWSQVWRGRF